MATLIEIANKKNCDAQAANTGKKGCQIGFLTPLNPIAIRRGTVIPKDTEFNKAYLNGLIAARTATPLVGAVTFEDQSSEDGFNTLSSGVERFNLAGLKKYMFTYQEGHEFYRELSKMTSFKRYDWIIFDEAGNMKIAVNSDGDYVGFSAGQVTAMLTKDKVQGGEDESKSLTVQFTNRKQWNTDYAVITIDNLDFDVEEDIQGVNSASFVYDTVPSAGTSLVATLLLDSDMNTVVGGIVDPARVLVTINGVSEVASALVEGDSGKYTITTTTALVSADVVGLSLDGVYVSEESGMFASGETFSSVIA